MTDQPDEAAIIYEAYPLTPERWPHLEQLFGPNGAYAGCWCMWWRITGKDWHELKGEPNRAAFKEVVDSGEVPGILLYAEGQPVGWCAIAPRDAYFRLREERVRIFKRVDDQPVWTITCFYISRHYRNKGLMLKLLTSAVEYAASQGATIIEGFPLDTDGTRKAASSAYTGLMSTFVKAGFVEVLRRHEGRPIMRYFVDTPSSAAGL
ncbi:MAG: GNAT family N-acetyltransferase [Chloroflexota bacterium]